MKKVVFLMMAFASFAFADGGEMLKSYSVLAAAVGLGLAALGGAIGMGTETRSSDLLRVSVWWRSRYGKYRFCDNFRHS